MSVLARILERVRERLDGKRREVPLAELRRLAEGASAPPRFREALQGGPVALIAEAKRASPSRGLLRDPYDPLALAKEYEEGGARAISVLTEPDFFLGALEDLETVADSVRLPVLRKDFVIDPYQCWEAKGAGAAAVLLIAAALDDSMLRDLSALAAELGLAALVEVHTEKEAERALAEGATIVGVNNRDLLTFEIDLGTTRRIARVLPEGILLVSESGIFTREDVLELERAGACAVLVGEALLVAPHPGAKVRELLGGL